MAAVDPLRVSSETADDATTLRLSGRLDASSYRRARDCIVTAALAEVRAVIVDVDGLDVPDESAWAVFASAYWHITRWPEVPILLVCGAQPGRRALARNGVSRFVPVYASHDAAQRALATAPPGLRRRVRAQLPEGTASLPRARRLVADVLARWSQEELIGVAKVVITTFVENVLVHTDSAPGVRLETDGQTVTVAVEDDDPAPPTLREDREAAAAPAGLHTVARLVRAWGTAPSPAGKTVWAVLGPENRI